MTYKLDLANLGFFSLALATSAFLSGLFVTPTTVTHQEQKPRRIKTYIQKNSIVTYSC